MEHCLSGLPGEESLRVRCGLAIECLSGLTSARVLPVTASGSTLALTTGLGVKSSLGMASCGISGGSMLSYRLVTKECTKPMAICAAEKGRKRKSLLRARLESGPSLGQVIRSLPGCRCLSSPE